MYYCNVYICIYICIYIYIYIHIYTYSWGLVLAAFPLPTWGARLRSP